MSIKEFKLKRQLEEKQIKQLLEISQTDPLIKKFTSDEKRFKDLATFGTWSKHTPDKFVFVDEEANLIALVWFSHKKIPIIGFQGYDWSLALRVYAKVRGRGLAKEFLNLALNSFRRQFPDRKLWLTTSFNNLAAIQTYEKFAFKKVSQANENGKILMVLP